ncbi:MAG: hypothetical protein DMG09_18395 [Acidobacteria bacterium]|nr:MAG: hypothetical protein DMG09_18395 [Acidobacteriota bacterium]
MFDTTGTARDGALMARRAAQEYVRDQMEDESFVAVYGTGISMHIFQPFTKDRAALLKAIEEVTSGDMQRFGSISSEIRAQLESIVGRWSDAEKMTAAYGDATSYISRTASQEAEGEKVADARSSPTTPDLNSLALASLRTLLVFHLLVYFTVYPAQPSHAAVEAILEFVQNGKPQARAQGTLPAADANGRVQYVTTVGLENFE